MKIANRLMWCALAFALPALAAEAPVLELTSPLGTKFYSLPDPQGVVAEAEKAVAADPRNPDLLLKLAQAQISVWLDREAAATCTRALAITPRRADILTERGHRELPLREFKQARADLDRSASLDPKRMDTFYHLGLAHFFLGEFAQAGEAFRRAVENAPNTDEQINATNWVCASFLRARKDDAVKAALERITPEMKNTAPHTLHYLSLVRFFQGRMSEAEILPPEPPRDGSDTEAELRFDTVAFGLGNWHLAKGDREKAIAYFRRVLQGRVWVTWGFIGSEVEMTKLR